MMDPLLLLPGHMCDARVFHNQIDALSGKVPLHLAQVTEGRLIAEIAENVLRTAPPRFALAGLSMGGIVAMEIARIAPSRVSKYCFIDTNHLPESESVALERERRIARVENGELISVVRDELKPTYLANGEKTGGIMDLILSMALDLGPEVFIRQSRALKRRTAKAEILAKIDVPTLVLCGLEDRLCPVERHREIAEIVPGANLEIISGAGHLPTLEQPGKTNALLREWMELNG